VGVGKFFECIDTVCTIDSIIARSEELQSVYNAVLILRSENTDVNISSVLVSKGWYRRHKKPEQVALPQITISILGDEYLLLALCWSGAVKSVTEVPDDPETLQLEISPAKPTINPEYHAPADRKLRMFAPATSSFALQFGVCSVNISCAEGRHRRARSQPDDDLAGHGDNILEDERSTCDRRDP